MKFQFKAHELTKENKAEAEQIARRLFGASDYQGVTQVQYGKPGMESYINRVILPKIRPAGSKWQVVEDQELEDGFPKMDEYGFVDSIYRIKQF